MKSAVVTVGLMAAVLAVITGSIALWPQVGWQTPNNHQADIDAVAHTNEIQTVLDAVKQVSTTITIQVETNRDEWWCDEEQESLDDLITEQDNGNRTTALAQDIMDQRKRMDETKCFRFDND